MIGRNRQIFRSPLTIDVPVCYAVIMMKTLTHEDYLIWQSIYAMTDFQKEEVDTICTALMNLGMSGETARVQALCCFNDAIYEQVQKTNL